MRQITIADLQGVLAANCDFHDAEIVRATHDPKAEVLEIELASVYEFDALTRLYSVSIPHLLLRLNGVNDFQFPDLASLAEYDVLFFEMSLRGVFYIATSQGRLRGTCESIWIDP